MAEEKEKILEKHENNVKKRRLKSYNLWKYATLTLGIIVIVMVALNGKQWGVTGGATVSSEEAATKAITYVNANLMQGSPTKVSYDQVTEENGMYKMGLKVGTQVFTAYVTKDGKLFFPQAISLDETPQAAAQEEQQQPADVPKADKPKVELFIMSHCPYGTQAEKGILPVAKLLGNKIDFSIKFVDYAMHGDKEVYEELNQYCIETEQNNKYFAYLECFLEAGDGESCLAKVGIDKTKLEACKTKTDQQFSITANLNDQTKWAGGRFPPFNIYKGLNDQYGVQGSPTLVVNGQQANSGRDSASYLNMICSAFNVEPEECKQTLSSTAPSPGFGGGSGASSGGQCG